MERELWTRLYRMLVAQATRLGRVRPKRARFTDAAVAGVYFWSVLCDRPVSWATHERNWPAGLRPFDALPSQSTLSRRLAGARVRELLASLHESLASAAAPPHTLVKVVDAKPLPVGGHSRVKDARWGQGVRGMSKGYKLHALYEWTGRLPVAWEVVPMNASEQRVARRLFRAGLRGGGGGGYVLADSVYDVNALYELAAARGHQRLARRKRRGADLGHRRHSVHRLRAIDLLEGPCAAGPGSFGRTLYAQRTSVE